jgi:hypothetical protein
MTDLQQARADWLTALQRVVDLEAEVERLKQANFELRYKLIAERTMVALYETTTKMAMSGPGLFT